jgi:hypothetical protein
LNGPRPARGLPQSTTVTRRSPNLVIAVYVVLGAWAVHALRYAIAPAGLGRLTHGYLQAAPPVLAGLFAIALARLCGAVVDRRASDGRALSWQARWALAALGFAVLYGAQENVELIAATGHAAGPAALLAHGGWIVLPLVIVAAGLLAALLRVTEVALERLHAALTRPPAPQRPDTHARAGLSRAVRRPRTAELARHLAGRAPPLAS